MKVSLVQFRSVLGDFDKNSERVVGFLKELQADSPDLVVFPELALSGYFLKDAVYEVSVEKGTPRFYKLTEMSWDISFLIGGVLKEGYKFYNSAMLFQRGEMRYAHRKVYLPTYGMFEEQRYFTSGNTFETFNMAGFRNGVLICEDAWHISSSYILSLKGAEVIFVLSASPSRGVLGDEPLSVSIWRDLLKSIARFFGVYVVFVNRVGSEEGVIFWGGSKVISPLGEVIAEAPIFDEYVLTVEMDRKLMERVRIYSPLLRDEKPQLLLNELRKIVGLGV